MREAINAARAAGAAGEVPVGACLVMNNTALAIVGNRTRVDVDPTAHAEVIALREAARALGNYRLTEAIVYSTIEPCAMCAAAISFARIRRLYFGAPDVKGGAVEHGPRLFTQPTCHHAPEIYGGIGEARAAELLKRFFAARR